MATVSRNSYLQLKTCPYNSAHKVKTSKFQNHVSNCARQYEALNLKECPFNSSHRIPHNKYEEHLMSCSDNRRIFSNVSQNTHKKEKFLAKTDDDDDYRMKPNEDLWSEQYEDIPTTKGFDVLSETKVTADWLFNERKRSQRHSKSSTFFDTIYMQRMSYEERKRYQMLCVEDIKNPIPDTNDNTEFIDNNHNNNEDNGMTDSQESEPFNTTPVPNEVPNVVKYTDIRPPIIQNPFVKGIKRNEDITQIEDNDIPRHFGVGVGRGIKRVAYRKGY